MKKIKDKKITAKKRTKMKNLSTFLGKERLNSFSVTENKFLTLF